MRLFATITCVALIGMSADAQPLENDDVQWFDCRRIWAPPTIADRLGEADAVVFGCVDGSGKTTDVIIHDVLVPHPLLKDRKVLAVRSSGGGQDGTQTFLVYASLVAGKLEYTGAPLSARGVAYVRMIQALDPKKPVKSLRLYLGYLEDRDPIVAQDVYRQIRRAPVTVRDQAAKSLAPGKLWPLLRDPKIGENRRGVYASLLASCGTSADADPLFAMFQSLKHHKDGLVHSMLALNPTKYSRRLKQIAEDKATPFLTRFYIWRGMKSLYESRRVAIPDEELLAQMAVSSIERTSPTTPSTSFASGSVGSSPTASSGSMESIRRRSSPTLSCDTRFARRARWRRRSLHGSARRTQSSSETWKRI